jgi:hypothetical protein
VSEERIYRPSIPVTLNAVGDHTFDPPIRVEAGDEIRLSVDDDGKLMVRVVPRAELPPTIAALADALDRACGGWEVAVRGKGVVFPQLNLTAIDGYRDLARRAKGGAK